MEPFLLAEGPQAPDNILILGRQSNLDLLERSRRWQIDGTFKIAPIIFSQIFVVRAEEYGSVHPVVYGLLPDKNRNPNSVSCDYELAAFQSVSAQFPNTSIDGCFFHFVKNFKNCLRNNNLLGLYNNAPNFALQARMIPAMAFVPIPQLNIAFAALGQILPVQLQPILEWLDDNYMG